MLLLGRNKHRICFGNIQGEFIAIQPIVQLYEIVIKSFIKNIIRRLVAQTRVTSIHGDDRILDSMRQIIYINKKKKGPSFFRMI